MIKDTDNRASQAFGDRNPIRSSIMMMMTCPHYLHICISGLSNSPSPSMFTQLSISVITMSPLANPASSYPSPVQHQNIKHVIDHYILPFELNKRFVQTSTLHNILYPKKDRDSVWCCSRRSKLSFYIF